VASLQEEYIKHQEDGVIDNNNNNNNCNVAAYV
jgi:hypothetical protein